MTSRTTCRKIISTHGQRLSIAQRDTYASDSRTVQNIRAWIIATSYLRQVSHSLVNNLGRRIVRDAGPAATSIMLVAV